MFFFFNIFYLLVKVITFRGFFFVLVILFLFLDVWQIELPPWTDIVKTGTLKELAPYDPDWYYIRAGMLNHSSTSLFLCVLKINSYVDMEFCNVASMARKIYLRGGLGVGAFRRIYGGSKRNGSRPPHFGKSSGSVARHILQQLQNMSIIELDTKGWVTVV